MGPNAGRRKAEGSQIAPDPCGRKKGACFSHNIFARPGKANKRLRESFARILLVISLILLLRSFFGDFSPCFPRHSLLSSLHFLLPSSCPCLFSFPSIIYPFFPCACVSDFTRSSLSFDLPSFGPRFPPSLFLVIFIIFCCGVSPNFYVRLLTRFPPLPLSLSLQFGSSISPSALCVFRSFPFASIVSQSYPMLFSVADLCR